MKYEYNGNLLENDRINLVATEIIDKYPFITMEKAQQAAMLEGRISSSKTTTDEINRLYNIMLVSCDDRNNVLIVFNDFLKLLNKNSDYINLADGIYKYLKGSFEFPILSDYI